MTVKLEAILSIEDSLANRLQKTWRKLSKQYKAEVTKALNANDPVAAQEVADSVDMTPVYTENEQYIRMQTYASLMHGATRLTPKPKDTSITTGAYAPAVDKVMLQFKKQITGSATEQVKKTLVNLIAQEFYEAPVEVEVKKYNPHHDPETGRFTSGPKGMVDELWQMSQGNPFDPRIRLMPVHPDHADDLVGIEARLFDGRVHLSSIITFSPKGKGAASRALRQFTDLADKYQVEIDGYVKPIDGAGDGDTPSLTKEQLHKWYANFGFIREAGKGGDHILRKPKSALVAKYSQTQPRYPKGHPQGGQWSKTDQRMARAEAQGYDTAKIWYHGRQGDFESFDPTRSKHADAVYLTPDSHMAAHFSNYNWQWNNSQRGENIMPLLLPKNLQLFDYENPEHLKGLANYLEAKTGHPLDEPQELQASNKTIIHGTIDYFVGRVADGAWPYVESDLTQSYIKSKYHGFYVTERGKVKNVAIYNAAMIRSVWAEFEADQWRSTNVLKFDDTQPRWPEGHPKGGQWKETEATSANFVVDDLDAVGMTPNLYDYHRDADYFRESKGLVTKIVWMSPDAYLQEGAEILAENSRGRSTAEEVLAQRRENTGTIDWLADALKNGPRKVAMPYLDRRKKRRGQEGMHRSLAAKKLGLTAIPVMLIEDAKVTLQKYDGRHYLSMDDILVAKYDKNQPRYPAGHPQGGQWRPYTGPAGEKAREEVQDLLDQEGPIPPFNSSHELDGDALVRALGGDPAAILQRLADRQAAFMQDENNRGIRVDAELEGDVYPMEEFTKMLDFFPDHSIEHFVLEQGEAFDVPGTPPRIDLMTPKECFSNAGQLTAMTFTDDGKYDYVEGYVIDRKLPFPIHHAWLVDNKTNKVVDPTLGWRPTAAYYGIRMKRTYVRRKLVENGYYGILTDGMRPNDIVLGTDEDFDYK